MFCSGFFFSQEVVTIYAVSVFADVSTGILREILDLLF